MIRLFFSALLFTLTTLHAQTIYDYAAFKQDIVDAHSNYGEQHDVQHITREAHEKAHLGYTQKLLEVIVLFTTANTDLPDAVNRKIQTLETQLSKTHEVNKEIVALFETKGTTEQDYKVLKTVRKAYMQHFLDNITGMIAEIDKITR